MVFDFGALPPEINSGRIYAGPGSAPLIAAATAWDALASELQTTAASYASTIGELTTSWQGPSSAAAAECRRAVHGVAEQHRRAGRADGIPGSGGGGCLRGRLRCQHPAAGDRGQSGAAGRAGRNQLPGPATPRRSPPPRLTYAEFWAQDAGRDVRVLRRGDHRESADTVHRSAGDHQRQRAGDAGGQHSPVGCRLDRRFDHRQPFRVPDSAEHRTDKLRHRARRPLTGSSRHCYRSRPPAWLRSYRAWACRRRSTNAINLFQPVAHHRRQHTQHLWPPDRGH